MLPHLDLMIPALNDATSVYNATLDGKRIKCSAGNLFKLKFGGLNLALCASGAEGVHVYGSDMEITVKYLDAPVKITAPKLSAKAKSECEKVVNATAVTSTSAALLTGEPILRASPAVSTSARTSTWSRPRASAARPRVRVCSSTVWASTTPRRSCRTRSTTTGAT